ncbi:hypothetical protein BS17DRAFT_110972 [Gyrodon lividus]|nr:hypothetical protein BS17DRAFT_110972 [Gyrodon lividus]
MMTNTQKDISEFVIKRKRKRLCIHAEDTATHAFPALSVPQAADTVMEEVISLHSHLIPEIAILTEPESSPEFPTQTKVDPEPQVCFFQNLITVDEFLRRSSEKPTQARQKLLRASLNEWHPPPTPRTYVYKRAPQPRTQPIGATTKQLRQLKMQNQPVRMSETLFRAAVLAHGDPLDSLMDTSASSSTRRPLDFVPFNKFAALNISLLGRNEFHSTQRLGNTCKLKANRHRNPSDTRRPLDFVPLREAEVAYSIKFQRTLPQRSQDVTVGIRPSAFCRTDRTALDPGRHTDPSGLSDASLKPPSGSALLHMTTSTKPLLQLPGRVHGDRTL